MLANAKLVQDQAASDSTGVLRSVLTWLTDQPTLASQAVSAGLVLVAAWLAGLVARRVIATAVGRVARRTATGWDDALMRRKVFHRLAHLVPALVIYYGVQLASVSDYLTALVVRATAAAMVLIAVSAATAFLSSVNDIYERRPEARNRPIKGFIQVVQIALFVTGGIVVLATLLDRSPLVFLSGIGAMTAVLLLIFRDTILSFVASLQMGSYDLVRVGDWIEAPQYGADGDVVDVALHTVKVQNWDKTITTIPTHKLIDGSFKNWRAMPESGGRRIKRAVFIDMNTVRFLEEADVERFERFALLTDYIRDKRAELAADAEARPVAEDLIVNARRLTNLGTFRAYLARYLKQHPKVHEGMTLMVRQRDPTPDGLPLEVYAFSNDTDWVSYEGIQSDIFDHILAVAPEFGLRVFQHPAGRDFEAAIGATRGTGV
jgi:miniconductance mechanosensitive channel